VDPAYPPPAAPHYISYRVNFYTALCPSYARTCKIWLCPAWYANSGTTFSQFYSWLFTNQTLPPQNPANMRMSYFWMPTIPGAIGQFVSDLAGRPGLRLRDHYYVYGYEYTTEHTVIMQDAMGRDASVPAGQPTYDLTTHLGRSDPRLAGRIMDSDAVGGNVLYGDGQIEWIDIWAESTLRPAATYRWNNSMFWGYPAWWYGLCLSR
jgi:hypothetical protein